MGLEEGGGMVGGMESLKMRGYHPRKSSGTVTSKPLPTVHIRPLALVDHSRSPQAPERRAAYNMGILGLRAPLCIVGATIAVMFFDCGVGTLSVDASELVLRRVECTGSRYASFCGVRIGEGEEASGGPPCLGARVVGAYKGAVTGLRLRGGRMGPHARLDPAEDDILVHHRCTDLPNPDHSSLKSALHRARKDDWNGRRIFVSSGIPERKDDTDMHRYSWKGIISLGSMPGGTGNHSVARISGDDEVQLWGKWHVHGPNIGIFQGVYTMYLTYGPYKPLMMVTGGAQVLFEQCEIRNFGGKCIVARSFSEVTLDWCTVGGSAGSKAPDYHKKLQVWDDRAKIQVANQLVAKRLQKPKNGMRKKKDRKFEIDWSKQWAPGWAKYASDGVSVESGSWLFAHRVCFEDTGRIVGAAVRGVGHAIINLHFCRFQRNRINLASDATVKLAVKNCQVMAYDKSKINTQGYKGDLTEFKATRSLRLPGNGTSILEAQQPTSGPHIEWREVTPTNRYWQNGMQDRGVDPARQRKRIEQRGERKKVRDALKARGVDPSRYVVHASHQDFAAFNTPKTQSEKRTARNEKRRHTRTTKIYNAPETLVGTEWDQGGDGGAEWIDVEPRPGRRRWDDELGIGISSDSALAEDEAEGVGVSGAGAGRRKRGRDDVEEGVDDSSSMDSSLKGKRKEIGALGDTVSSSDD